MARNKQRKRKAAATVAAAAVPTAPGLPPKGGVPQVCSDVSAQARGMKTVDTMVDTTVVAVDSRATRCKNRKKRSPQATKRSVTEGAYDSSLVAILRETQEEYWDQITERNSVDSFITKSNDQTCSSNAGITVLDPTLVMKIKTNLEYARVRLAHFNYEKAHAALTSKSTVSNKSDPADWKIDGFREKLNRSVPPEDEKKR